MRMAEELILFLELERCIDEIAIDDNTKIEEELGILGDDSHGFINSFSKEFNVVIS